MGIETTPMYGAWKRGIVCLQEQEYGRYLSGWAPYCMDHCCYCGEENDLFVVEFLSYEEDGCKYHGVDLRCEPCMTQFPNQVLLRFQSRASGVQECITAIDELIALLKITRNIA